MKVIVLQNMSSPDAAYKKGRVYDVSDELSASWIESGHAVGESKKVVETATPKLKEAEKAVKLSYKK